MNLPPIVSPQEWKPARERLLIKEKELTRAHDALAAERRRMPRMADGRPQARRARDPRRVSIQAASHTRWVSCPVRRRLPADRSELHVDVHPVVGNRHPWVLRRRV